MTVLQTFKLKHRRKRICTIQIEIPLSTIYMISGRVCYQCGGLASTIECRSIAVCTGHSTQNRSEGINMTNKKKESLRFSQCFPPQDSAH